MSGWGGVSGWLGQSPAVADHDHLLRSVVGPAGGVGVDLDSRLPRRGSRSGPHRFGSAELLDFRLDDRYRPRRISGHALALGCFPLGRPAGDHWLPPYRDDGRREGGHDGRHVQHTKGSCLVGVLRRSVVTCHGPCGNGNVEPRLLACRPTYWRRLLALSGSACGLAPPTMLWSTGRRSVGSLDAA